MQAARLWEASWLRWMIRSSMTLSTTRKCGLTDAGEYVCNTLTILGAGLSPHQTFLFRVLLSFFLCHLPPGSQIRFIATESNHDGWVGLTLELTNPVTGFL